MAFAAPIAAATIVGLVSLIVLLCTIYEWYRQSFLKNRYDAALENSKANRFHLEDAVKRAETRLEKVYGPLYMLCQQAIGTSLELHRVTPGTDKGVVPINAAQLSKTVADMFGILKTQAHLLTLDTAGAYVAREVEAFLEAYTVLAASDTIFTTLQEDQEVRYHL